MEKIDPPLKGDWIEIPDAVENPSPLLSAIEQMKPAEVLALWHGVRLHDYTVEKRPRPTPEVEDYWSDEIDAIWGVAHGLDIALWQLPQHNIEHARAVYASFADSLLDDDREHAGFLINGMTPHDHDFGLMLWDRLMRDPSELVRRQAHETLHVYTDKEAYAERGLAILGISWPEAAQLLNAYGRAQTGFGIHSLSRAALGRLLIPQAE